MIERDRKLVSLWDWMSLQLCHRFQKVKGLPDLSAGSGAVEIRMSPQDEAARRVGVEPWPFAADRVHLVCEGRRLLKTHHSENAMRKALKSAAPVTLTFELVPAETL